MQSLILAILLAIVPVISQATFAFQPVALALARATAVPRLDLSMPSCSGAVRRAATAEFKSMAASIDAISAYRRQNGTYPRRAANEQHADFQYRSFGKSYAFVLKRGRSSAFRSIASCTTLAFGEAPEVRARGLFTNETTPNDDTDLLFSPQVGFYLVPHYSMKEQRRRAV